MTRNVISISLLFGLLLAGIASCSSSSGFNLFSRGGGENPPEGSTQLEPTETTTNNPEATGMRLLDTWTQPAEPDPVPVDIFFIEDTSGSLDDERPDVTVALEGFLQSLESKGIDDYCIGVMLAHGGVRAGRLRSFGDNADKLCLCSQDFSDGVALRTAFGDNFERNLPNDNGQFTDGGEVGIYSFYKAIESAPTPEQCDNDDSHPICESYDAGCFRETAAIVPIFVSDENDISTSPNYDGSENKCDGTAYSFNPEGPATNIDAQCAEPKARTLYYSDADGNLTLGEETLYEAARNFQGLLPFMVAVVGYVNDLPNTGNEDEFPYGYAELADRSGGDRVDLKLATDGDQSGFDLAFSNLGDVVATKIKLRTVFDLTGKACEGTIAVTVDGEAIGNFLWNGDRRVTISAGDAGSPGSTIEIVYDVCI